MESISTSSIIVVLKGHHHLFDEEAKSPEAVTEAETIIRKDLRASQKDFIL